MSDTYPTHLPLVPPQSDPYFVGTLHLTGCESESQSSAPPPIYEAATTAGEASRMERLHAFIGDRGQDFKALQSGAIGHTTSKPAVKWDKLITACEKATSDLEASLVDLDQNWFKAWLLKEEKSIVQQHIEEGLEQVHIIYEATQAVCLHATAENVNRLQIALDGLATIKADAIPKPTAPQKACDQDGPMARILKEIQEFFSPVLFAGWGLLMQSGLLSPEVTKNMPFIGSFIGFGLAIKNRIDAFNEKVTTEDRARFMQICNSLMESFMELGKTTLIGDQMIAIRAERDKNIAKFDTTADGLLEKFSKVEEGYLELKAEFTEIKQGIALLLKQSNAQHVINQKIVENAA